MRVCTGKNVGRMTEMKLKDVSGMDKEELVGLLLVAYVSPMLKGTEHKKQAVERYMRSYLRGLTYLELRYEEEVCKDVGSSYNLEYKVKRAQEGYDRFMKRRGKGGDVDGN